MNTESRGDCPDISHIPDPGTQMVRYYGWYSILRLSILKVSIEKLLIERFSFWTQRGRRSSSLALPVLITARAPGTWDLQSVNRQAAVNGENGSR